MASVAQYVKVTPPAMSWWESWFVKVETMKWLPMWRSLVSR